MTEYAALIRFGLAGVALLAIYAIGHHVGYGRGVEDKVAYYEPILRKAADAKIEADKRASAAESRAIKITTQVEQDHADLEKTLSDRAVAAEQRIVDLLRQRTATAANGSVKVPVLPGSPSERPPPTGSDQRDQRFAASVSDVARRCEHDASELAEWQRWYDEQRSSLIQLTQE